jgi:hypothetical protein
MPVSSDTPDPVALAHVRSLLAGGHYSHALETALAAAGRRGGPVLDTRRKLSVKRFLLALQATAEELEGIRAALAAGEGPTED